jgi:hypothetical protein
MPGRSVLRAGLGLVVALGGLALAPPASAADSVTLSGTLRSPAGMGSMEYGSVRVLTWPDAEYVDSVQTDDDGTFALEVPPGSYELSTDGVVRTQSVHWSQTVDVLADTSVDFVGVPVAVRLVNQNGRPRFADVSLQCDAADATQPSVRSNDRGAGTMTLVGTPVGGGCELSVYPEHGSPQELTVPVTQAGPNLVTVTLPSTEAQVSGTVALDVGDPVAGEVRVIHPGSEDQMASAPIAADGGYSLTIAEPGDYVFEVVGETDSAQFLHRFDATVSASRTLDLGFETTPVTVSVEGSNGSPRSATLTLDCVERYDAELGEEIRHYVSSRGSGEVVELRGFLPGGEEWLDNGCRLLVEPDDGDYDVRDVTIDPDGPNEITVVVPDRYEVVGSVSGPDGQPLTSGQVRVRNLASGDVVATGSIDDGAYALSVESGTHEFLVQGNTGGGASLQYRTGPVEVSDDQEVHLSFPGESVPVTVHLVGEGGTPEAGGVYLECSTSVASLTDYVDVGGSGTGTLQGLASGSGWTCTLTYYVRGTYTSVEVGVADGGSDVTVYTPTGAVIDGDPDDSVDGDGVPDLLEAQGPNGGDGNGDGTPDHEQAHVTSLPVDGSADPADPYLTIAGPTGSTLTDVTTVDEADLATPPPAGVSLPAGLASFTVTGLAPGADAIVSVHPPSMTGINGYAKYDEAAGTWSLLPAGRVQVLADHLDVTLTDGGVGDTDGAADGRVVDPGGVAVVPVGDVTPPTVTGRLLRDPNAEGWYAANVRVRWTATDPSGVVAQAPDTIVTGEGADLTAQSALVCDRATPSNCTRGTLSGIRIDRTAPTVSVTGVSDGATYTLGAAPTAGCTASDALSGTTGSCTGVLSGGTSAGVGRFTYTATATDRAGNRRTVSVSYRVVYRFSGFLQPVNDPATDSAAPMSVFRRSSTVSVGFRLLDADGDVVAPSLSPVWLAPVRGSRTGAAVNEAFSTTTPSGGSAYTWRGDRWQYDWSTRNASAQYRYRLGVRLDDGTTRYVTIGVR